MTTLSDKELTDKELTDKELTDKELTDKELTEADIQYFRDKLIRGLQRGHTAAASDKSFKQLALIEDVYNKE